MRLKKIGRETLRKRLKILILQMKKIRYFLSLADRSLFQTNHKPCVTNRAKK